MIFRLKWQSCQFRYPDRTLAYVASRMICRKALTGGFDGAIFNIAQLGIDYSRSGAATLFSGDIVDSLSFLQTPANHPGIALCFANKIILLSPFFGIPPGRMLSSNYAASDIRLGNILGFLVNCLPCCFFHSNIRCIQGPGSRLSRIIFSGPWQGCDAQ